MHISDVIDAIPLNARVWAYKQIVSHIVRRTQEKDPPWEIALAHATRAIVADLLHVREDEDPTPPLTNDEKSPHTQPGKDF